VGGYFNLIASLLENKGGVRILDQDTKLFQKIIQDLNLVVLETNNGIYTWNNKRGGERKIASRLD